MLLGSCKSDAPQTQTNTPNQQTNSDQKFGDLPPLPAGDIQKLFDEATYIDYIFFELPFSISQDDKPSIHSNLGLLSSEQMGGISPSCRPIGREFFHIGGTIAYEAEVYFSEGCYGYVFYDGKQPKYANKVSDAGMKFYTNIIAQAQQIQNKALNGR